MGFSNCLCFLVVPREDKSKQMIIGIGLTQQMGPQLSQSGIGLKFFFSQKSFRDVYLFFENWFAETLVFIVSFGCAFLGQVVKKGKFWTPPPRKVTFWQIIEKLNFVFSFWRVCFFLFFDFVFFCFGGRVCFSFLVIFSLFLLWEGTKPVLPPPKKGILAYFSVSPFLSP